MRLGLGIGAAATLIGAGGGGGAPDAPIAIVNARGNPVGDTAGGFQVTIEVTNSAGLTGATVGGVALTGFAISDGSHVTGTMPDLTTAGLKDVVVSNGVDSSPLANGWRAWDPSVKSPRLWLREDRTTSGTDITQWTDKSGNGYHFAPNGNPAPQVGTALGGHPTVATNGSDQLFTSSATLDNIFGTAPHAFTLLQVGVPHGVASGYFSDAGSWAFFSQSGQVAAFRGSARGWDTNYRTATSDTVIAADTPNTYEAWADLTDLKCRMNGDTANEDSTAFTGLGGSSTLKFGELVNGATAELIAADSAWSQTDRDYFVDYACTRYGFTI